MAVNLMPDPGEEDLDSVDAGELVVLGGAMDDEGAAADPSRLRALWERIREEVREADVDPEAPRVRSLTVPALGPYLVGRGGLAAVKVGAVIIFRGAWTLIRRGWVLGIAAARKARSEGPQAPAATPSQKDGGEAKAPVKGAKAPAKKGKGRRAKAAPRKERVTADLFLGYVLAALLALLFVTYNVLPAIFAVGAGLTAWLVDHPVIVLQAAGFAMIIFVPIAWIVGAVAGIPEDHENEDHDRGADPAESEAESPHDQKTARGSGTGEAESDGGEVAVLSPEERAEQARIRTYEWVRASLKTRGNGTAVHLRELLIDVQKEEGREGVTMAELRAGLEAHGITVKDQVKAPASDKDGATRNRPGVHRDDLPQGFTPLPTPGSNLIRLLPTYQGSDQ
ncbi:hypothetical protein [Streptomyces sp. MJM1172]|uniref:hypothetical protein n=1 Tax=Streptomyces sp. MJM1172 TaxID=1703926 RepID=UPI000939235D|nr:hypothetical protein [Streptomyces sp. MJM1172]OKI50352.1 hypothetical protein AMK15_32905 [Streptomyces sp. MJM1172]